MKIQKTFYKKFFGRVRDGVPKKGIKMKKIIIGCDHAAYDMKLEVIEHLKGRGYDVTDVGCDSSESVHYPVYALAVAEKVASGEFEKGILICGTGIGMSIAANKVKGIRAAVCENEFSTEMTRAHNDANILCMGARVIDTEKAIKLTDIFLDTAFMGDKHLTRINMIKDIENK